ncbi:MAG TPA: LuxR C-terminal-related transcriptional regulator [Rhizomicrobium sp.]|nr:LuxR C-terminal-related transcriptional regulator [Rhizomicrobium sp.]
MIPALADMRGRVVQEFSRAARAVGGPSLLRAALCDAARALGFHHVLLQGACGAVWLADMPPTWRTAPTPDEDAVLTAAAQSLVPFLWSDIPRLVTPTAGRRDFLEGAVAAGVGAAMTVPVHRICGPKGSGGYSVFAGCCTFAMKNGACLPLEGLAAAHHVGALALDAAERLCGDAPAPAPATMPSLTPRQRDCVVLVAQGKSDWEIGQLLGISESTVHKHIEDAKRRFGVSTRIQLVVRSLFDARLTFADVMK